jgi:hypothetical protein
MAAGHGAGRWPVQEVSARRPTTVKRWDGRRRGPGGVEAHAVMVGEPAPRRDRVAAAAFAPPPESPLPDVTWAAHGVSLGESTVPSWNVLSLGEMPGAWNGQTTQRASRWARDPSHRALVDSLGERSCGIARERGGGRAATCLLRPHGTGAGGVDSSGAPSARPGPASPIPVPSSVGALWSGRFDSCEQRDRCRIGGNAAQRVPCRASGPPHPERDPARRAQPVGGGPWKPSSG